MKTMLLSLALATMLSAQVWNCSTLTKGDAGEFSNPSPTVATFTLNGEIITLKIGGIEPREYVRKTDYLSGPTIFANEGGLVAVFLDNPILFMVTDSGESYLLGECIP